MSSQSQLPQSHEDVFAEGDLLLQCRRGDEQAWKRLYEACIPLVRRRAFQMGFTPSETNDILQDTLVTLCHNIHTVKNVPAFVRSVCYRRCVDAIRRRNRWKSESIDDPDAPGKDFIRSQIESWTAQQQSEDEAAARLEALSILRDHLATMGAPCESLLRNRFLHGMSYQELGRSDQIPEKQVGVYLSRCIKRLKNRLQQAGSTWPTLKRLWMEAG